MSKESTNLRKMYLLSDSSMQRLKELDKIEKEFTELDKRMKKILYSKELNAHDKWILYNDVLGKYNELRRQMAADVKHKNKPTPKKNSTTMETQTDDHELPQQQRRASVPNNPFTENIRTNVPDINGLSFANEFENQNNDDFYQDLEYNLSDTGNLEPISPNSSRRLSAATFAIPLRYNLNNDPSWLNDSRVTNWETTPQRQLGPAYYMTPRPLGPTYFNTPIHTPSVPRPIFEADEEAEMTNAVAETLAPQKRAKEKTNLNITLYGNTYSINKDDEYDFREFAAESFGKSPHKELTDADFQKFKKRKMIEFKQRMEEEKQNVENERERVAQLVADGEQQPVSEGATQQVTVDEMTTPLQTPQRRRAAVAIRAIPSPRTMSHLRQVSVSNIFQKTKGSNNQMGKGKKIKRWISLK